MYYYSQQCVKSNSKSLGILPKLFLFIYILNGKLDFFDLSRNLVGRLGDKAYF